MLFLLASCYNNEIIEDDYLDDSIVIGVPGSPITPGDPLNLSYPCENGMAGDYPCNGYDLQSFIPFSTFDADSGNDSWGWTDPQDGTEYALMGLNNGTVFIDISDPINPIYLGKLPTHTTSTTWRDVKVYNNYAFVVSEANNHGMQVFDLTVEEILHNGINAFEQSLTLALRFNAIWQQVNSVEFVFLHHHFDSAVCVSDGIGFILDHYNAVLAGAHKRHYCIG